jgi:hypothetical protein
VACAGVLFQTAVDGTHQPIMFWAHKFSGAASNWDIHKKEAYSIYGTVRKAEHLLRGKKFIIENDHLNLLYMESNDTPIIARWRIYLQSFMFLLRHIPGKQNIVADWMSRMYVMSSSHSVDASAAIHDYDSPEVLMALLLNGHECGVSYSPLNNLDALPEPVNVQPLYPKDLFDKVHGGRRSHPGELRTWKALCKEFPGHGISMQTIYDFVRQCPVCQKIRQTAVPDIQPLTLHLKPPHARSRIGVDVLTITPTDTYGNTYCIVVVEHFTKFATIYPSKTKDDEAMATALFQHFCRFGTFDELLSDPGSDLTSKTVVLINKWFGIDKMLSLVNRPQSNGVEPTNKKILRHLRALVHDERVVNRWSDPTVLPIIEYFLNVPVHSETGVSPIEAKFGSADSKYFVLPSEDSPVVQEVTSVPLLKKMNEDIQSVREVSLSYQKTLIEERLSKNSKTPNVYAPDSYVLYVRDSQEFLPTKLSAPCVGPFIVMSHVNNDVTCRHPVIGVVKVFHSDRLKAFAGTPEDAYDLALRDHEQFVVAKILAYRGDPLVRTTMEFEVEFADGQILWKTYDLDLFNCGPYEDFCRSHSELYVLLYPVTQAVQEMKRINDLPITSVAPGDSVYVDLRWYGRYASWYQQLGLPDPDHSRYVVRFDYTKWSRNGSKIEARCLVFGDHFKGTKALNGYFVFAWGSKKVFTPDMILVDEDLIVAYPSLIAP